MQGQLQIKPYITDFSLSVDELPLITVQAQLPVWQGKGSRRFNRYYRAYSNAFLRHCRTELFPQVSAAYQQARECSGNLPQWQAILDTTLTCQTPRLISLYTNSRVLGTPHRLTLRRGDTWDIAGGCPMALSDFFPRGTPWRKRLLEAAAAQIHHEEEQGLSLYDFDWTRKLHHALLPCHFYLTESALCLFCQMGTIAPVATGIPTFCLPFHDEEGPFSPAHFDNKS